MTDQRARFEKERELFLAACRVPRGDRARFLAEACASDPSLRRRVEKFLAADEEPLIDAAPAGGDLRDEAGVEPIEGYRLRRRIGEGGMGEVWEAEQEMPLRRRVALKLIKRGMDTHQVVARFESERQALALMDHSAIAKVFDAGSTTSGRPYFVMEYVQGAPITDFCDEHRLTVEARLRLFLRVCHGVQHAHQKGIIHRDLKPANILVALGDDGAQPKIIDFGIAKATEQGREEPTALTEQGQWLGTPDYMSPEQLQPNNGDIDTRSDVYSLGAVLYELLVGEPPLAPCDSRDCDLNEITRRIREVEPLRPSARLRGSQTGQKAADAAFDRGAPLQSLIRRLHGDLDWITLKALEKDRSRRYSSATELAMDIERCLHNEPVLARPPSTGYRIGKLVRRHRAAVAATVLATVALLAGTAAATIGLLRAQKEARATRQSLELLVGFFQEAEPGTPFVKPGSLRELLNVSDLEAAGQLLRRSLAIRERELGPEHPDVASNLKSLAAVALRSGDFASSAALLQRALAIYEKSFGPIDPRSLTTLVTLAHATFLAGHSEEALLLADRAERLLMSPLTPPDRKSVAGLYNLACVRALQGEPEQALGLLGTAVDNGLATPVLLNDPDLDSLRSDARFTAILEAVKRRLPDAPTQQKFGRSEQPKGR